MTISQKIILIITTAAIYVQGAESITPEQFSKMNFSDQTIILEKASPEMKESLKKIYDHQMRIINFGSDDEIMIARENLSIEARGLSCIVAAFSEHVTLFERYYSGVINSMKNDKEKLQKGIALEKEINYKERDLLNRFKLIHTLIFNTASTESTLIIERKAAFLNETIFKNLKYDSFNSKIEMTPEEFNEIDKKINILFEEIKTLPKLTPEQVKKEYDNFPEDKVSTGRH